MFNLIIEASVLAGTIIGAGMFALPYLFSRIGYLAGFVFLVLVALVYYFIHLRYAEVIKNEPRKHYFLFLAKKYLGADGHLLARWVILGELLFIQIAYLIIGPSLLSLISGINLIAALLIFWAAGSLAIFLKNKEIGLLEVLGAVSLVAVTILILLFAQNDLNVPAFDFSSTESWFLAFAPLIFSMAGRPAIPKVVQMHKKHRGKHSLAAVILLGTSLPVLVYMVFALGMLKLSPQVSVDSLSNLNLLSPVMMFWVGLVGLIAVFTSYLIIGRNFFDVLNDELKEKFHSAAIAMFLPLILVLIGVGSFLAVIGVAGGMFLALDAVLVNLIWARRFNKKLLSLTTIPFYLVFGVAFVYESIRLLRLFLF